MILRVLARQAFKSIRAPAYGVHHIKNMVRESARVDAQRANDLPLIANTDKIYKPTHTVEFNREGEVLLYSSEPLRNETIYFKYPYVLCKSIIK